MKYIGGLHEYIRRELKLFKTSTLDEASKIAIAIEGKFRRGEKPPQPVDKKEQGKKHVNTVTNRNYCDHCKRSGHTKDKCWKLHPDLHPRNKKEKEEADQKRKDKGKALLIEGEEITGMDEVNENLILMTKHRKEDVDPEVREELFHLNIQVKKSLVGAIIDSGSQKNLISEAVVQKLGLTVTPHPSPYPLGWIHKNTKTKHHKSWIDLH